MTDAKLDRIENKIDRLQDSVTDIKVTQGAQHEVLSEHMRRTLALEKIVVPLSTHVALVNMLGKIVLALVTCDGLWYFIKRVFHV